MRESVQVTALFFICDRCAEAAASYAQNLLCLLLFFAFCATIKKTAERTCRMEPLQRKIETLCHEARQQARDTVTVRAARDEVPVYESAGFVRTGVWDTDGETPLLPMAKSFALEDVPWVSFDAAPEAVLFRNDFLFPADAGGVSLRIVTHGFCEVWLNGTRIADDLFVPAWTNYNAQDFSGLNFPIHDTFCHRSYFLDYDLTAAAKEGVNAFAVHIGDGWYGQWESGNEGMRPYGEKKLCFALTVRTKDGSETVFTSGDGGVWRPSFVCKTSMYYGEAHDLRLLESDFFDCPLSHPACRPVKEMARPYTLLQKQPCPPDRVLRRITDAKVLQVFGDRTIYDLGENVAGFAVLRFDPGVKKNERVTVRYAENLNEDGSLNFHSTGGTHRLSIDVFRAGAKGSPDALLQPRFLWHAGRYVEVTGRAKLLHFCVAASDVPVTAAFRSSDPVLNFLFDAYIRTQQSNIHTCVPSDCPHRERLGYTGDGQLTAAAAMTMFDAKALYQKWMRDIADCQDIRSGHVQHTAPFYGGGGGPGGWGCAVVEVPYQYWKFYGERSVLEQYYPNMKKYLDYMEAHCDDHLVMREEPKGWCLGDWCTPDQYTRGVAIPEPFVNTYFYIRSLRRVQELAPLVGKAADLPQLKAREEAAVQALCKRYFDDATGSFCGGVCGADAFALDLGLGDSRTKEALVQRYRTLGTFDTGIFGTQLVIKQLFELGDANDAVRLLSNRGDASFYGMMQAGATTLWEMWHNEESSSHPMFGAVAEYLFKYILGIRQPDNSAGFADIRVDPAAASCLDWAEGSVVLGGKRIFVRVEHGKAVQTQIMAAAPQ